MKNRNLLLIALIVLGMFALTSCADVSPYTQSCVTEDPYGFWGGLWHGMIAPFSFIGSLFSDDIAVYALDNNGGWYNFGFVLGIGALTGGGTKASSRR
jgi:hypothetical protein